MKRMLLIVLVAMLPAACATSPTGRSQLMLVSPTQLNAMGIAAFDQMRQQGKFARAPDQRAYATCVADALIRVLPPPYSQDKWQVEIIDDQTANAFALPGGRIGVNLGMFKVAKTPAELAAVLGHELAHVVARHPAERVSDQLAAQVGVAAASAYAGTRGIDPDTTQALLGMGTQVAVLLPFSRTQESEADVLGQRYMAQAGFDPAAAVALWQNMEKAASGSRGPAFLSTHPSPGDRIARLQANVARLEPVYRGARAAGHAPHCPM
jgi:predicted Zn-dependent protease